MPKLSVMNEWTARLTYGQLDPNCRKNSPLKTNKGKKENVKC